MDLAVETRGLSKRFGDFTAVDGIDLAVPRGSFYGFLGPNGAGKSTTIHCLTGLLEPTAGRVRILGLDPAAHAVAVKRRLGVVLEDLALFDQLTAEENLAFTGEIHALEGEVVRRRSRELLELMELDSKATVMASYLSRGMRKKLALAVALLPAPRLLFLDEPFEGLDAIASRQLRHLLVSYVKGGGTIFLTSHILDIVARLCDHLGIIANGRLVAQGTTTALRAGAAGDPTLEQLFLGLIGAEAEATPVLPWLTG